VNRLYQVVVIMLITLTSACESLWGSRVKLSEVDSNLLSDGKPQIAVSSSVLRKRVAKKKKGSGKREAATFAKALLRDALELHRNLITWNSFEIATALFPAFVGARMVDKRLQNCFYDRECHKNIWYFPKRCHDLAQWSIAIPIILIGGEFFFTKSEDMRETSRIFLLGLPFVIWTKTLIKKIQFEANMRPWHEDFDRVKRASGGFPSGHMAEAMYAALLYGMRYGPRFAVPFGLVAAFVGVTFVACNRHYISQIVAGAGLGAVYAVAAYKLVDTRIKENMNLDLKISKTGPALRVSYVF
jgi:membrane-associated phospholipid phosphatase